MSITEPQCVICRPSFKNTPVAHCRYSDAHTIHIFLCSFYYSSQKNVNPYKNPLNVTRRDFSQSQIHVERERLLYPSRK